MATPSFATIDDILLKENFSLTNGVNEGTRRSGNQSILSMGSLASSMNIRGSTSSSTWTTSSQPTLSKAIRLSENMKGVRLSNDSSTNTAWTLTADPEPILQPPNCIEILPSKDFTMDANSLESHKMILQNNSDTRHVLYKVKLPNKYRTMYAITPNQGLLRPKESRSIMVEVVEYKDLIDAVPERSTKVYVHQFLLQLLHAPDTIMDQLEYMDISEQQRMQGNLWTQASVSSIQQTMLNCSLRCTRFACLEWRHTPLPSICATFIRRHAHGANLTVTNPRSTTIAYKIKSNCGLAATPAFGLLSPHNTITIHIAQKNSASINDRLRLETVALIDVEEHLRHDSKRTLNDIRRAVHASWQTIDESHISVQMMHPWDNVASR